MNAAFSRSFVVSAIKSSISSSSLPAGESLHALSIKAGLLPDTLLANHLLNLYSKSHSLDDAHQLFDEMPERNLISYSTLISANSRSGHPSLALRLTSRLRSLPIHPNHFIFSSSIAACSKLGRVRLGEQVHAQAVVYVFGSDTFVGTTLIDMYSKLGDHKSAASVFGHCPDGDPVMFNSMVSSYVSFGSYEEALRLFGQARREFGFKPTEFSFGSLIKACSELGREVGEQLHGFVVKIGFDSNCFIGTSLVDMYGKYGDMESLEMAFESVSYVDVALYNAMIVACSKNGFDEVALECFRELRLEGFKPNQCTLSGTIKACGGLISLELGRSAHGFVEKSMFHQDLVVSTALIDMYMKCGEVKESRRVFDCMPERNTISYNSMISGHGQNGNFEEAMRVFVGMNRQCIDVDLATFISLATSCSGQEWSIYAYAIKQGFGSDFMLHNALLDGLVKKGAADDALEFFNKMKERNVISWSTIISGTSQLGLHSDAIQLFKSMSKTAVRPNSYTFSSILKACGCLTGLEQGRCIHGCAIKHGVMDEFANNSLLDMYAKNGDLANSRQLFDEMIHKDIVSWNTMIRGYAQHGYGQEALELYTMMKVHNVKPSDVTFISLLSACSHSGLVEDAVHIFELMVLKHQIEPCMEHYACMVDVFGRAGMLDRAKRFIKDMPFEADASVWTVVLAACKLNSNIEYAKIATDHIMGMRSVDNPTLVTLSTMYSEAGNWMAAEKVRGAIANGTGRKEPGLSWL